MKAVVLVTGNIDGAGREIDVLDLDAHGFAPGSRERQPDVVDLVAPDHRSVARQLPRRPVVDDGGAPRLGEVVDAPRWTFRISGCSRRTFRQIALNVFMGPLAMKRPLCLPIRAWRSRQPYGVIETSGRSSQSDRWASILVL